MTTIATRDKKLQREILYKYAELGAQIFPCCWPVWDSNGEVHCGAGHLDGNGQPERDNIGKRPLLSGGYHNATQTRAGIDELLLKYPDANFGAHWENQIALDVDQDNNAFEDLARLEKDIGILPPTLEQISGSEGLHKIYLMPEGTPDIKASTLPRYDLIHVKINGYVIVAGSLHKCGGLYRIKNDIAPTAAPKVLIDLFLNKQGTPKPKHIDGIKKHSRHIDLISLIGKLRNDKLSENLIEIMAQSANAEADIPLPPEEVTKMRKEYENQTNKGGPFTIQEDANGLPEIRVTCRNTKDITADAIDALNKSNNPPTMFMRGSLPVRVSKDEKDTAYIEVMGEAAIRGRLDRVATYVKYVKIPNKQDEEGNDVYKIVPTQVPLDVVRDVMTLPDFRLPALANITEIPTLRADGTILAMPGYDKASGLFYVPARDLVIPKIPENPTTEEIRNVVNLINEVYINFPFDSQASRANFIAATATPIYRPMIDGSVPLHITDKPQAGTGAGLATQALCMITTGRGPAMFGAPKDEDEWGKVIFAAVKAGQQIIVFDNCDGMLYSSNLARLITAPTIGGRILGHSENAVMPNNSMIFCNGNNITLGGDLPRRSYLSRLETDADRPWERECIFLHSPLIPWVKENQGRIVAAYLIIAKAWIAAGRPIDKSLTKLGSFEEWQRVIGGILKYAGIDGFLGNRETVYEVSDTDSQQWESFAEALAAAFPTDFIVADVVNLAFPKIDTELTPQGSDINNTLPDIVDRDQRKFSKSLGHALIKKKDVKWHNDLVIIKTNQKRHSAVVWKISNWREKGNKRELPDTNSHPPGSQGSFGEL